MQQRKDGICFGLNFNPTHTPTTTWYCLKTDLNKAGLDYNHPTVPFGDISPQGENGYTHFNRWIYQVIESKDTYHYRIKGK